MTPTDTTRNTGAAPTEEDISQQATAKKKKDTKTQTGNNIAISKFYLQPRSTAANTLPFSLRNKEKKEHLIN